MPPVRCNANCQCDAAGYCIKSCSSDAQCSCGERCDSGECKMQCKSNNKCPKGQICLNEVCSSGCVTDNDCPNEKTCSNSQCISPCDKGVSPCGRNALCHVSQHQTICLCPNGHSGDPLNDCVPYECNSDVDCAADKQCSSDKTCKNPCLEPGTCGINAQCRIVNRQAQCQCVPGYFGNPSVECKLGGDAACLKNPCGINARCRDMPDATYECSCPPNCIGDANKNCVCEIKLINLCKEKHCGINAVCRIVQDRAECYCPNNYPSGNPIVECKYIFNLCFFCFFVFFL